MTALTQPESADERDQAWIQVSTWMIVAALVLLSGIVLAFGLFSFSDPAPGHTLDWHIRRYRLLIITVLTVAELSLIAAIAVRDYRRRKVELLLRESEERMAFAASSVDLGLWRWDAEADQFWATDHGRSIFGLASEGDPGLAAIAGTIHPDDRPLFIEALSAARESRASFEVQFRLVMGDGQLRWIRLRGRAGIAPGLTHLGGTVRDITERMTMQAEIERQRQSLVHLSRVGAIGELSGALAHELNQPLTAILSNAQAIQRMLRHSPINMEELRSAIADIIADDSRAGDVIRHLRTLLKKEETRREPVDMKALVNKVIGLARNELVTRHVMPVVKLVEDVPAVLGDAVQLQQLLLNLVLNAAEAIASTGQQNGIVIITGQIVGEWRDSRYHLSVSDTGPGIRSDLMDKLFEPFFSTKKQGLGLGLSISHAIVEGHGGTMRAESNSWGGATFHVFLPLVRQGAL